MAYATEITPEKIRAVIKSELKLADVPMGESFYDLGFSNDNLVRIQNRFTKTFGHTVNKIFFIDTVYTIHERITAKPNTHERIKH